MHARVSRPYFSTRPQGAYEKFGQDYSVTYFFFLLVDPRRLTTKILHMLQYGVLIIITAMMIINGKKKVIQK